MNDVRPTGGTPVGATRCGDGYQDIYTGAHWIAYPKSALTLIDHAREHGWEIDDGLPPKVSQEGNVHLRILLTRYPERNPLDGTVPGAYQFHITWRSLTSSWELSSVYMSFNGTWQEIRWTLEAVRKLVAHYPVKLPSPYPEPVN
jgi:hypothetical protein